MLENDYSKYLNRLLDACECDLAVPSEWQDHLARQDAQKLLASDRRQHVRHQYKCKGVLECDQTFPSIPRGHTISQVMTRDISRGGIGFLHSEQLFPGEQIALWLPVGMRHYVVERCIEHSEFCFEVGASVCQEGPTASTATSSESCDLD